MVYAPGSDFVRFSGSDSLRVHRRVEDSGSVGHYLGVSENRGPS